MKASELIKRAVKWHLWDERETDCTRHKSVYACNAIKSASEVARLGLPKGGVQEGEVLKAEERAIAAIMGRIAEELGEEACGSYSFANVFRRRTGEKDLRLYQDAELQPARREFVLQIVQQLEQEGD